MYFLSLACRLRSEGVELDKSDFDGRTPLHNASKNGEVLIVAYLLKTTRVNLEARDRYCMSLVTRKPVFGVSDQLRLKPDCSATETS